MSTQQGIEKEITVLTNKTINVLLKENADALALYIFYTGVARTQKTNKVWANDTFCRTGLGFGEKRFKKAKEVLLKYNLVEFLTPRQKGRFSKPYVKVNYLFKKASLKEIDRNPEKPEPVTVVSEQRGTNALSKDSLNALSKNKEEREKNTSQISYLLEIPKEDVRDFCTKFKISPGDLYTKAETLHDYCIAKGKRYSDYKALLRNAVRKDFGTRNDAPGTGDVVW